MSLTGASLGIVDSSSSLTVESLDSEINLRLINTGNEPLQVVIEERNTSEFSLEGKNITLGPSIVESPGSKEGLYYIDGRYFDIRTLSLDLNTNRYRTDNSYHLPITVRGLKQSDSSTSISNRVVTVLDKTYDVKVASIVPMDTKISNNKEKGEGVRYTYDQENSQQVSNQENNISDLNSSESYKDKENQKSPEDTGSSLTYILILGIIGTGIYIIKAI